MIGVALVGVVGASATILPPRGAQLGADVRDELFRSRIWLATTGSAGDRPPVTRLTNDVDQVQEAMAMFLRILVRAVAGSRQPDHGGAHLADACC